MQKIKVQLLFLFELSSKGGDTGFGIQGSYHLRENNQLSLGRVIVGSREEPGTEDQSVSSYVHFKRRTCHVPNQMQIS